MPTIKISFAIDQDHLLNALRAMAPYAQGGAATILDVVDNDQPSPQLSKAENRAILERRSKQFNAQPAISAVRAAALFRSEKPTPQKRKVRKGARRLRVKAANRPTKENGPAPVRGSLVELVKKAGASGIDPKALHDAMVGEGFDLQSSYNALFEAKRKKEVKLQNGNVVAVA